MVISSVFAQADLAGYLITIAEIANERKCRLAFDSIALRYAWPSMCLMSEENVG
jgi:hypothetical protein